MKDFRLTEDHLKLLRRAFVGWQDCETGAPEIDPKRPYGNSFVVGDVVEILGWEGTPEEDEDYSDETRDRALELHSETLTALQILLASAGEAVRPGLYRKTKEWDDRAWKRVSD